MIGHASGLHGSHFRLDNRIAGRHQDADFGPVAQCVV
jgi:hypothetical protein